MLTGLRRLSDVAAVLAARPGDLLLAQLATRWAADPPSYALGGAVGTVHRWDGEPKLVVVGDPDDVVTLMAAYDVDGVSVPEAAGARLAAERGMVPDVGWAFRWTDVPPPAPGDVTWLDASEEKEVAELLADAFPHASMPVGHPDVRRWAGLRRDARLVACLADATSVPGLGFLASIATHPDARGTRAATAVTAFATAELVREHGACGLWHTADNTSAIAVYDRTGYTHVQPMAYLVRAA